MSNIDTVKEIYEAFGRGDISGILSKLADNVDWEYGATTDVPWLQSRRGRDAVAGFFESMAAFDMRKFEPHTLLESGSVVVTLINVDLTVKSTGVQVTEEDEVHIWRFDDEGRVARFAHKLDTHQHVTACHGDRASA